MEDVGLDVVEQHTEKMLSFALPIAKRATSQMATLQYMHCTFKRLRAHCSPSAPKGSDRWRWVSPSQSPWPQRPASQPQTSALATRWWHTIRLSVYDL